MASYTPKAGIKPGTRSQLTYQMADYSQFKTSLDPEFLQTQSRPTERTRDAAARQLATTANRVQSQNLIFSGTVSVNPGSINAQTRGSVSVTITNVSPGDFIDFQPPTGLSTGLVYGGNIVASNDTVTLYLANITGSPIDDGANSWRYRVIRLS